MATLEQALETAGELPLEQQEMLADILRQRRNETWRRETAAEARGWVAAFHDGKLKAESSDAVIALLREQLDQPVESRPPVLNPRSTPKPSTNRSTP